MVLLKGDYEWPTSWFCQLGHPTDCWRSPVYGRKMLDSVVVQLAFVCPSALPLSIVKVGWLCAHSARCSALTIPLPTPLCCKLLHHPPNFVCPSPIVLLSKSTAPRRVVCFTSHTSSTQPPRVLLNLPPPWVSTRLSMAPTTHRPSSRLP
jgi:hypothetical protein